jgi:DNA modification methylase
MAKEKTVEIKQAKGRPMLNWVGKRPLKRLTAFPAQKVEVFGEKPEKGGLLYHGDNKEVLTHLLANGYRGKIDLIYIDPPFDSGADYVRKIKLRGRENERKLEGEGYTIGEQIQYTDIWINDNYLQFMYERLQLLKELLADSGTIALHCDSRKNYLLRCLLDEVFGSNNFRGEVIVRAGVKNVQSQFEEMSNLTLGSNTIFLFSKSTEIKYPKLTTSSDKYEPGKWDTFWRGTDRPTMRYRLFDQKPEHGQWRWQEERAKIATRNYEGYIEKFSQIIPLDDYYLKSLEDGIDLDFMRLSEDGSVQYFVPPRKYKILSNVWLDLPYRGNETDYPTEKHEAIINRLVHWITTNSALILDCFIGSGTTAAVAQKLGRRWIGCDINKGAIQTTAKRLQTIIQEQVEEREKKRKNPKLFEDTESISPEPAQYGFTVYRINDYDLQIQHNEAVNLACEHIGVTRIRSDGFFDGTLGKSLVKITPFNHPLSPLDLEEIKKELAARPDEQRDIMVVCLGKELAVEKWLEDWNRLRKRGDVPNKIEVVELRTHPRYGKLFIHKPATAKVEIERKNDKIKVEIKDFMSPSIIEHLVDQSGTLQPTIDDWRAMVDCVMIDPTYDGQVFNVAISDIPEKKTDFVAGTYELEAPQTKQTVAVKIIDMLGEEVLEIKTI